MSEHQQIKADIGLGTFSSVDMRLSDFKAFLDERAVSIGADDETANVFIEYEHDPYDGGGSINAWVWRWETDEELATRQRAESERREADVARHAAEQEQRERATLAALKAKYGDAP